MNATTNQPGRDLFKLAIHYPHGRTHKPAALFNKRHRGVWRGEIGDGLAVEAARVGGRWQLVLRRGERSAAFAPVVVTPKPFEVVF